MVNERMYEFGTNSSVIRELFEFGKKRKAEIGDDNVFDFSIGNPSIPAPACVNEAIEDLIKNEEQVLLHGYTSAPGDLNVRKNIADFVNKSHGTNLGPENFYMTVGAAASLSISLKALTEENDEFIVFAPFFPEYSVFVENAGAKLVILQSKKDDFQPDLEALEKAINIHTKGIIINSPNNPSGVVIKEEYIKKIAEMLEKKQEEYKKEIFIITDEPYRELVYGDVKVPYIMNYYDNTIVCYSYSKSLSLPGERIGYIAVSNKISQWQKVYAAVCGAGRSLGYVCAPSLFQQVIGKCQGAVSDVSVYEKNRDLLYNALTEYGYRCIKPDGAFYLFVEALEDDANKFSEKAKEYELLLVPSDSFGTKGFVRISYCVSTEQIKKSLPAFKKLAESYKNN